MPPVSDSQPDAASFEQGDGPPVEVGAERTTLHLEPSALAPLFRRQRAIVCPGLLDPALLQRLLARCRSAEFRPDHVAELGTRAVEAPQRVGSALNILLQRAELLRWLEAVTGRGPIATVAGRLVQTHPNGSDRLRWHNDLDGINRLLGITINLTDTDYVGGDFEMRPVDDRTRRYRFHHARAGTALIFDIGSHVEHRVTPLESGGPRRVYTGWFMRGAG